MRDIRSESRRIYRPCCGPHVSFQRLRAHSLAAYRTPRGRLQRAWGLGFSIASQPRASVLRGNLGDLLRELALDARYVERLEHVAKFLVLGHDVAETGVQPRDELQRLCHLFFHAQIYLEH